jgi:hypothetical protein
MDVLGLLEEAEAAGLRIAVEDEHLHVHGPRAAEAVVRKLAEHKPQVMAVLRREKEAAAQGARGRVLEQYLSLLEAWRPKNRQDLPPAPTFDEPRERSAAWAAWWDAIERRNREMRS